MTIPALIRAGRWRHDSPHSLSTDLYIWVTRGQGRVSIDGMSKGFGPNTLMCLPRSSVHSFEIGNSGQGYALFDETRAANTPSSGATQIKAHSIFDQGQVTAYFESISKEITAGSIGSARAINSYIALIDVWIDRNVGRDEISGTRTEQGAAARLVQRFVLDLEQNFCRHHSVTAYATRLSVTPTHLTRVCQQICKISASHVIQKRQVLAAQLLLTDENLKINAISQMLDFQSPAYFSRFFTKHAGCTPKAYRQKNPETARNYAGMPRTNLPLIIG